MYIHDFFWEVKNHAQNLLKINFWLSFDLASELDS